MQTDKRPVRFPRVTWFGGLPIVERHVADLSTDERRRIERIAAKLLADEPSLSATGAFGPMVQAGMREGPALFVGDHADTELLPAANLQGYDYRLASLAGAGDLTALYGRRDRPFEEYRRDFLGLGELDVTEAAMDERRPHQLALRLCKDEAALAKFARLARREGRLTLVPYQGNGGIWVLAMEIARRAGVPVHVGAPPPRLARRINDKTWFARRVVELCGAQARPGQALAYGPAGLVAKATRLARDGASVVVKVPSSAGSLGNIALDAGTVGALPAASLRDHLIAMLTARGWAGTYPLLVEVWDSPVINSPSVQLWIPAADAPPVIEGVFEQAVEGPSARFVGAVPSTLPDRLIGQLCHEAALLARLLQGLGYYGRCSFDSVVFGDDAQRAKVHWIECNGRWGGVSIPMTLANRLTLDWPDAPHILIFRHLFEPGRITTADVLERLKPVLFRAGDKGSGVVLLTPRREVPKPKLPMLAIASSAEAARALAARADRLLAAMG